MKKLFTAIRASDLEMVRQIIEKEPELVNCVAKKPSPLQVALKTGNTAIANYLLDMGADVNFIEDESCCNAWRTPVLHDAINCAVMSSRWNTNDKNMGFREFSTKEKAAEALDVLKRMLDTGADVNACDSYASGKADIAIIQLCGAPGRDRPDLHRGIARRSQKRVAGIKRRRSRSFLQSSESRLFRQRVLQRGIYFDPV